MKSAIEIAVELKNSDCWDFDLCEEFCELAGLSEEWISADGDDFERVVYEAAEILGVEI